MIFTHSVNMTIKTNKTILLFIFNIFALKVSDAYSVTSKVDWFSKIKVFNKEK